MEKMIVPYVNSVRDLLNDNKAVLVMMQNSKCQNTNNVLSLLKGNNIHVCVLLSNMTNRFQPIKLSLNNPAKSL